VLERYVQWGARMIRTPHVLAAFSLCLVVGCVATDDADDNADLLDTAADKADGSFIYPQGIYNNDSASVIDGDVKTVILSADMTFWRQAESSSCSTASCGVTYGKYTFSHSGSTHYIRFLDQSGKLMNRFAFRTSSGGDKLQLRKTNETTWFDLTNLDTRQLSEGEKCADDRGNSLGQCPDNFGCEYDGPGADAEQDCLPMF
jgi:hypothetical protein